MNIIYGSIPRDKTAVFTAFRQVVEGESDSGTLFFAFPIVDVTGMSSAVDGLLISQDSGLVVFDLEPSSTIDPEKIRVRQDDLYVGLQSRFIKHEACELIEGHWLSKSM